MTQHMIQRTIVICRGTGCNSLDAEIINNTAKELIHKHGISNSIKIKSTGCHGFCQVGPTIKIEPENIFYIKLKPSDIPEIIEKHLINGDIVERLLYRDPKTKELIPNIDEIPFFKEQKLVVTKNCGKIDPEDLEEYIESGGYTSLKKVLKAYTPLDVINEVMRSGLRGRGGGGFLTAQKWLFCRETQETPKYLVCNADEGDPGAFMDRSILESDPHSVIEGMVIAAYAIGANLGYIYIREEYPLAIKRFSIVLKQAKENGYLGKNIFSSGFDFDINLVKGAGAFVCGEETALTESIMGKRGEPRPRPPFPAKSGLWNKPTNINNVKTFAYIPRIIEKGADWFSSIGTDDASGTIVIALTGKINNSGLIEVPMGTTIRKIVFDIGGGIPNNKEFKAIQTGGPSGGCIPKEFLDTPLDYKHLTSLGSIMGSGGFIVLDEDTCMVDLAHYFNSFTQKESCGKCVPCRIGTKRMLNILTKIKEGTACTKDLKSLEKLANIIKKTSLCGLGQTAPNPVLTTLKYFRNEYEAHIYDKSCPAAVCENLFEYKISEEKCIGCSVCKNNCSSRAIIGETDKPHSIIQRICSKCGLCYSTCPYNAISKKSKVELNKVRLAIRDGV